MTESGQDPQEQFASGPPWEAVTIQVGGRSRSWEVGTLERGGLGYCDWRGGNFLTCCS